MRTSRRVVLALLAVVLLVGAAVAVVRFEAVDRIRERVAPEPSPGCIADDPTSSGCVTPATLAAYEAVTARFAGGLVESTCWSEHAWNPSSDHPEGRACDFFPTRYGTFAAGDDLAEGWAIAQYLRDEAAELDVRYVIWQGRIWYRGAFFADADGGWGRPYDGGGVYDAEDATGGHYDHVHVSIRR
ncbi:hypothetical protein [Pseudonocardia sp. WMMC193]|uniref:hypothetical protein n=1 Tax=Pseudonocardia sp. WMMC193 TaxID=2911965 RepID=UPI001F246F6A|nr:hypothetical protein [Pseudonocardia sp. WMMC193]MCF7550103.1 hypothetical protein [Pseudonocardia sp. WMMC193]